MTAVAFSKLLEGTAVPHLWGAPWGSLSGPGASLVGGKAERAGAVQPGEERAQGDLINVYEYLQGECKENGARLFPVEPSDRSRGSGYTLKHRRFPWNIMKHCHCESDQALVQADQGGGGVSILADSQEPSGHGPGQLSVGVHA